MGRILAGKIPKVVQIKTIRLGKLEAARACRGERLSRVGRARATPEARRNCLRLSGWFIIAALLFIQKQGALNNFLDEATEAVLRGFRAGDDIVNDGAVCVFDPVSGAVDHEFLCHGADDCFGLG